LGVLIPKSPLANKKIMMAAIFQNGRHSVIQLELSYHEIEDYLFNKAIWPINTFKIAATFQDGRHCLSLK